MIGSVALDVVIGLVFIYTLYSLLTTTIVELIASYLQLRARNLVRGIERMLDDDDVTIFSKKFYKSPLIKYMGSGLWNIFNKPSYIQARNFSQAVFHVLKEEAEKGTNTLEKIKETLEKYKDTQTGNFLLEQLDEAGGDLEKFKSSLEAWFNDTMERVAGWYKRKITVVTFIVGLTIATIFNVDTFQIVEKISKDEKVRDKYIQLATQLQTNSEFLKPAFNPALPNSLRIDPALIRKFGNDTAAFKAFIADSVGKEITRSQRVLQQRIDTLYAYTQKTDNILSFKRKDCRCFIFDSLMNFWGCLITAIALSLGAPFWFDLLSKLMKVRGTIIKPSEADDAEKK